MNQDQFITAHEQQWLILEARINPKLKPELIRKRRASRHRKKLQVLSPNEDKIATLKSEQIDKADFPSLYREVCHHLSLAQSRRYSPYLIERLSFLVDQAHQVFYRHSHVHGDSATSSLLTFFTNLQK